MALKEKNAVNENRENRKNVRFSEYRSISVKDMKAGLFHKAKMLNSSKNGIYFETDGIIQPGAKIYLGTENSSEISFTTEFKCRLAELVWRKKLLKSFYNFGYDIKFITDDETKMQKPRDQKRVIYARKHPRKSYTKSLTCAANNQIIKGTTKNISPSVVFLKTEEEIGIGQTIFLSLPSKSKKRIKIRGKVVWSNHEGCGVKFLKKKVK